MGAVAAVQLEYEGATKVPRRSSEGAFKGEGLEKEPSEEAFKGEGLQKEPSEGAFKGEGLQKEGASGAFGVQVHVKYT